MHVRTPTYLYMDKCEAMSMLTANVSSLLFQIWTSASTQECVLMVNVSTLPVLTSASATQATNNRPISRSASVSYSFI